MNGQWVLVNTRRSGCRHNQAVYTVLHWADGRTKQCMEQGNSNQGVEGAIDDRTLLP